MLSTVYIDGVYKRRDDLFSLIVNFNCAPASYLHASYLKSVLSAELIKGILTSPRGQAKLSQLLLKKFNLKNAFYTNFKEPYLRLALLDSLSLNELALYAGIIYYTQNITQIVQKQTLIELKEQMGEKAYFFAIKKASLFSRLKPQLTTLSPNPSNLYAGIMTAGQRMLEYLFAGEPFSLTQRLQLKFAADASWNFSRSVSNEEKSNIFAFLNRLLIKEINPNLQVCFT